MDLPFGQLPGCTSISTYAAGCPGEENTYNDWVYYDFTGIPQNTPASFTIISGNTMFTTDGCGMYPLTVDFIIDNSLNIPDVNLCAGQAPGPVQLGGGASWTNNNPSIGLPDNGNGAVPNFIPVGPPGTVATISYVSNCNVGSYDYVIAPNPTSNFEIYNNGQVVAGACDGSQFDFVDMSTIPLPETIDDWLWDFGDGNTSNLQNPSHTYINAGTYNVSLTTTSSLGCESSIFTQQIIVYDLPQANFISTNVCANINTDLTDMSTVLNGTINNWQWDVLNDNTIESTLQNGVYMFTQGGTYDVELTVESSFGCSNSIINQVTVNYIPVANFESDSVCLGNVNNFNDLSAVQNGTITQWNWDFNGENSSASNNPTHGFVNTGNNSVNLQVTSNHSCSSSIALNAFVFDLPESNFTVENVCLHDHILPTNLSASNLTYNWSFGDANSSILQNPSHVYINSGNYQIDLAVTSAQNCTTTSSQNVVIYELPMADFTANEVCPNQHTIFTDASFSSDGVITNWAWDILNDNSTEYASQNAQHIFNQGGSYDVELTVESTYGCENSVLNQVTVNYLPIVNFLSDSVCLGNPSSFYDVSSIIDATNIGWNWDFGGGNVLTNQNSNYTFSNSGVQNVSLTVTSSKGCSATNSSTAFVYDVPESNFSVEDVCLNNNIIPNNLSASNLSYDWNFGDSNFSVEQNPTHNYNNAGVYQIELTVTSVENCQASLAQNVNIYDAPVASFTVDTTCLGTNSNYVNTSTIQNVVNNDNIINWQWDVDGDFMTDFSTENLIYEHSAEGFHNTNLIVTTLNGCKDTVSDIAVIWPKPEVDFTYEYVCYLDSTEFTSSSSVSNLFTYNTVDNLLWNFGDGNLCNCIDPNHQYQNVDTYGTKLAAITNHGCFNEKINIVTINPLPQANFSSTDVCEGENSTEFTDLSTIQSGNISTWNWTFGDGNSATGPQASNFYSASGNYDATLTLNSNNNCSNTITLPVVVNEKPTAGFTSDLVQVCGSNAIQFTDLSYATSSPIVSWLWNFGDETTTSNQNPNHTFYNESSNTEEFDISLTVHNSLGCSSTFEASDYIEVFSQPIASFNYNPTIPTVTHPDVEFENQSLNAEEYAWQFGDYLTSIDENPTHTYSGDEPDSYPVQLIAYNNFQTCSDTAWATINIEDVLIFYVPNAFTPDGDDFNNVWQPQFYSGYDPFQYHCLIFNRWGEVVWESYDASKGWDGNYGGNGLVEDGVYVWKINFNESMTAKNQEYVGHVTVLK